MDIHILLFLIMGIKTDEYIVQEKIQLEQINREKTEQQHKEIPNAVSAPPPLRVCKNGEISSDCRKLTQAEISSGVVRGKKQNLDDQTP